MICPEEEEHQLLEADTKQSSEDRDWEQYKFLRVYKSDCQSNPRLL